MNKTNLTTFGNEYEKYNFGGYNFKEDFDKYSAAMKRTGGSDQGTINRVLQAAIDNLTRQVAAKGGSGGNSGAGYIEHLIADCDRKINITVARATRNILAANTVGPYTAGQPMALPYGMWGYNDAGPSVQYGTSLQQAYQLALQALPTLKYVISGIGTEIWTWEDTATGKQDIVSIYYSGRNTTYINLRTNMSNPAGTFFCEYVNYAISDATNGNLQLTQADIQFVDITSGGSAFAAELLPNGDKITYEYLLDRQNVIIPRDKGQKLHFDANRVWVDLIQPCPLADVNAAIPFNLYLQFCVSNHPDHKSNRPGGRL